MIYSCKMAPFDLKEPIRQIPLSFVFIFASETHSAVCGFDHRSIWVHGFFFAVSNLDFFEVQYEKHFVRLGFGTWLLDFFVFYINFSTSFPPFFSLLQDVKHFDVSHIVC